MQKKKVILLTIIIAIITSVLTFFVTVSIMPSNFIVSLEDGKVYRLDDFEMDVFRELSPLINIIRIVDDRYVGEVDTEEIIKGAIDGAMDSLKDPYSVHLKPDELDELWMSIQGSFEGIGISVTQDKDGFVKIVSPIEGTPGQEAGLLPGDRIIKVDNHEVQKLSLDEAVALMRGPKGTKVVLTVQREKSEEELIFEIIRGSIELKTVKWDIYNEDIGYIKITSFDDKTSDDFVEALKELNSSSIEGLIVDLRNNPGGTLGQSIKVADELIGEGPIVYIKDNEGNIIDEYKSSRNFLNKPLVVLVNDFSASASEIVAGAVQDSGAGIIIGTKTFGKGTVQELNPLQDGSGLKLTVAKYHLPSGRSIDGKGIHPDINLELPEGINFFNIPFEEDLQLKKAIEVLKSKS